MLAALRPVFPLLAGVGLVMTGYGLVLTLLPLRGDAEGFSTVTIGAIGSAGSFGFVAGSFLAPLPVRRAGHARTFLAVAAAAALMPLLFAALVEPTAWIAVRFLLGVAIGGFYLVVESWLNDRADNATRGLVLSAYLTLLTAGFVLGEGLAAAGDVRSSPLFFLSAGLLAAAILPVALRPPAQPAPPPAAFRFRPDKLWRASPGGTAALVLIGAIQATLLSLAPLYATGLGASSAGGALFAAALFAGGGVFQWPIGRLSDFVDRRLVLIGGAVAAILVCCALVVLGERPGPLVTALGFLAGGFATTSYAVATAHLFDRLKRETFVEASAGVLVVYGVGAILGPFLASVLMRAYGPEWLFVFVAAAEALMIAALVVRLVARREPARGGHEPDATLTVDPGKAALVEARGEGTPGERRAAG